MPKVSLVIRTYNEKERLRRLLEFVKNDPVEVVVVDNGSTDGTAEVLKEYPVKIVYLAQEEFTYPKSLNKGVAVASGEIIVMLSAHCLPVFPDWVETVTRHFADPKVAGMYGPPLPEKDSPFFEKTISLGFLFSKPGIKRISQAKIGVLGGTNAAIRRSLWQEHPFDEMYAAGGEDGEWATWALQQGYTIIFDKHFQVYHSHYLTFKKAIKQQLLWRSLKGPRPFDPSELAFRDDIKRS